MTDAFYQRIERLGAWAADHHRGLNELAQAWLLAQPSVCSVISGATRLDHIVSNAKAASWALSASDLAEIEGILAGNVEDAN